MAASSLPYSLRPIQKEFGAIIEAIDLKGVVEEDTVRHIRKHLQQHRLLIFKGQGRISAQRQVEISRWFGDIHSTFYKHPASPHPEVFRVSNSEEEGCLQVGRSGWHIDGSFLEKPFKVQTMHFWAVCEGGDTLFTPLAEVADALVKREDMCPDWNALYFISNSIHPLIYPHPSTGHTTMCFHLGDPFLRGFALRDETTGSLQLLGAGETREVKKAIVEELEREPRMHRQKWEVGDFALIDNLAVAHYAVPETQQSPEIAGLRILHRTTVAGDSVPRKTSPSISQEKEMGEVSH